MKREEKQQLISELNGVFQKSALVVVTLNKGLTMPETTELRNNIRKDGASYRVTKNRLTKLALVGTPCEGISELMVGPTAIAYSEDPIAAAKAVVKFAKDNDSVGCFTIVGRITWQTCRSVAGSGRSDCSCDKSLFRKGTGCCIGAFSLNLTTIAQVGIY